MIAPSRSITATILQPSSSLRNFAAWKPTLPRPWTITFLPSSEPSRFAALTSSGCRKNSRSANWTPRPVASTRPAMPPALSGLPVTQAAALMSVVFIRRYWSTIHAISRSPVPMSGAGTFWAGLIRSRLHSS